MLLSKESCYKDSEEAGEKFLEKHLLPVIIDKMQYTLKLFRCIKYVVDRDRSQLV
jgi:hypothetical protein